MKKYFKSDDTEKKAGRWSDGFSNTKGGQKDKKNKPKKTDNVEVEDGTILLIDEVAVCSSLTGNAKLFVLEGASLEVNGIKKA